MSIGVVRCARHALALAAVLFLAVPAAALDKQVVGDPSKPPSEARPDGWGGTITVGASVAFAHAHQVVGQINGQSWTLGANIAGALDYTRGQHDWRSHLSLLETFTYGPPLNQFIKTADRLTLDTAYYFRIPQVPWLGPFAWAKLETAIFEGQDRRPADVTYRISYRDGTVEERRTRRLHLTESFQPLLLKEAVGMFARPLTMEPIELEIRLGFGSQQVIADGQLALVDAAATDEIEIKELKTFVQAGSEAALEIHGSFVNRTISYKTWAEALTPFIREKDPGDDRGAFEMTNVELGAKVSFKLVSWASLDYEFRAQRVPQMTDEFQIQNMLLLNFSYSRTWTPEPPPSPAPGAAP